MLGQYKFKILYTLGKDNSRADALSQRSNLAGTKTINKHAILRVNQDSILEPANPRTPIQQEFHYQVKEDNKFKVKKIKQHQRTTNSIKYLVK
jgi:hypothetical protein